MGKKTGKTRRKIFSLPQIIDFYYYFACSNKLSNTTFRINLVLTENVAGNQLEIEGNQIASFSQKWLNYFMSYVKM